MKQITKWKAIDGREFRKQEECQEYERLIQDVDDVMAELPARPKLDGCEFENGYGYILHDEGALLRARRKLLELTGTKIKHEWVDQSMCDPAIHLSYVARLVDDCGYAPLNRAFHRLMCIDPEGREWGQPYYAANPDRAEHVRLNP